MLLEQTLPGNFVSYLKQVQHPKNHNLVIQLTLQKKKSRILQIAGIIYQSYRN